MTRFFAPALLLVLGLIRAAGAFLPTNPSAVSRNIGGIRQRAASDDNDGDERDSSSSRGGVTAREARILAPASAALACASLGITPAALAADAPSGGSFESSLREYFPGALPNAQVSAQVLGALKRRGYIQDGTLFGASICSDEVNSTPNSLCAMLQKDIGVNTGGMFNLGGLGGLPFVGKSGFGAFFSHCPDSGKVVILFGPHVGISQTGVVGKLERVGMTKPSTACGAGIGAYKAILAAREAGGVALSTSDGNMDNQEEWIVQELSGKFTGDDIGSGTIESGFIGNAKMATVTYRTYDLVWELLNKGLDISIVNPEFWEKVTEVTLLGGIIINQGHFKSSQKAMMEDYFQPFLFQSWRSQDIDGALIKKNLFTSTFQMKNPKKELGL